MGAVPAGEGMGEAGMSFSRTMAAVLMLVSLAVAAQPGIAPKIDDPFEKLWRSGAPVCKASVEGVAVQFPSKRDCNDGDMTLFNGLLCAAGFDEGCEGVRLAQDGTGRWHRSPRLRNDPSLYPQSSFSPDMAIGVQLYFIAAKDRAAATATARRWVSWLEESVPCMAVGANGCIFKSPIPRFCTDDEERGCAMRPGDAALLASTLEFVRAMPPAQTTVGAYLRQFKGDMTNLLTLSATVNKPGYSRHLVAASALAFQLINVGSVEDKARVLAAANILALLEPENPFFLKIAGRSQDAVNSATLAVCPATLEEVPAEKDEWTWERTWSDAAWRRTMLWDCLFARKLR